MSEVEQTASNCVELIKSIGPYFVAIAGMAFGYLQSRKTGEIQENIAAITKDKDLEVANLQSSTSFAMEELKRNNTAVSKLQDTYSPMYAKVESVFHTYIGLVTEERTANHIKSDLAKLVSDDYIVLSVESRKVVLAEGIAICQMLKDHNAYEIAVKLDGKITEALSLFDFTGNSFGSDHVKKLREAQREFSLLYVSFFYRVSNIKSTANKNHGCQPT